MKSKTKGIIVSVFFGIILLTSTVALSLPNLMPSDNQDETITITGTPADNFPDSLRPQFCGTGDAKSTNFVKEFKIPTQCTQPLAITTSPDGSVWFTQSNTGALAKFDPNSLQFTEFKNPSWPANGRSMMWGIDYSPDGTIWFTDEAHDLLWNFSIDDAKYTQLTFPSSTDSMPQKIQVDGSQIIVNDFLGNKISFLDPAQSGGLQYMNLPSPIADSVTSDFALDDQNNLWYTNWIFQQGGALVKFDKDGYSKSQFDPNNTKQLSDFIYVYQLPDYTSTPNGSAVDKNGNVWLADTSTSNIIKFNPADEKFVKYTTSDPPTITYGNYSGLIKSPISRPYWIESVGSNVVFNEQTANRISVLDVDTEQLVSYFIPSMNPNWGDCGDNSNCGLSQVFGFSIDDNKIWFTEWAENNIGYVDTSIDIPISVNVEPAMLSLKAGESKNTTLTISQHGVSDASLFASISDDFLTISILPTNIQNQSETINVTISANGSAMPGAYKVLLGVETDEVSIGKFVTVLIES